MTNANHNWRNTFNVIELKKTMINAVLEVPRDHQALFIQYTSSFWSKKKKNTRLNLQQQESSTNEKPRYASGKKKIRKLYKHHRQSVNMTKPTAKQLQRHHQQQQLQKQQQQRYVTSRVATEKRGPSKYKKYNNNTHTTVQLLWQLSVCFFFIFLSW